MAFFDTNGIEPAGLPMRDRLKAAAGWNSAPSQMPPEDPPFVKANLPYYRDGAGGRRTYFADHEGKQKVIDAKPNSISTNYSDSKTVRAVLDLAEARGWGEIRARGSESFRREIAIQGAVRGIAVEGYKLTQLDRQEIAQRSGSVVQTGPVVAQAAAAPQQAASKSQQQQAVPSAGIGYKATAAAQPGATNIADYWTKMAAAGASKITHNAHAKKQASKANGQAATL